MGCKDTKKNLINKVIHRPVEKLRSGYCFTHT